VFQLPPAVADATAAAYRRVAPDSPFQLDQMTRSAVDAYQVIFTRAADGIREVGGFSEPQQWRYDWEQSYTRDEWLDQMPTFGGLTRLAPDRLAQVQTAVAAAIDAMGGSVTVPYATVAVTATREHAR